MRCLALASLVITGVAPLAAAQGADSASAQAAPCPPNAALAYWRAWNGRFPTLFDNRYLEQEFRGLKPEWVPPPEVAAVLEGAQEDIQRVMKAAQMDFCDWGVSLREEGFETIMPHLAKIRTTGRVLLADARRLLAKGDSAGAAERLAAMVLMARHLRNDKAVYCVRTAQSLAADLGMFEIRRLAEAGKWNEEAKKILVEALTKLSGPDPCGMREALAEEPQIIRLSVRRHCKGPDAAKTYLAKFAPKATAEQRAESGIEQLDEAGLYASADRAVVLYQDILANWDLPEPGKQIREIDNQRKAGDFGSIAVLTDHDFPHLRVIVARFEALTEETIRIVKGEAPAAGNPGQPGG
jgi:hypothetical protein